MKTESSPVPVTQDATPPAAATRLPLRGWALELARRWNGGTYSLFVLHGNIFDLFPVQDNSQTSYVPLKSFLVRRLFPERSFLLFYDISDGLTFGSAEMQKRFFEWLDLYDNVEGTNFRQAGPPRDFLRLAPVLRRFFLRIAEEKEKWKGVTLIIDFPEKLIPAAEEASASTDERMNLVTFLKWAAAPEMAKLDIGLILVTESAAELNARLLQNPDVAQVRIDLPDADERQRFLSSGWPEAMANGQSFANWSDFTPEELGAKTAGLNLLRIRHFLAEAIRNGARVTQELVTASKKRLIEEYCQGLVRFKNPKAGINLDAVATHVAAKKKLR
ncbi:MAG TPA: hypothetical protein VL793_01745, partial [Patescibacteria group bacterium]|nr:hypothetical protein [Patescibacteria group bacterium]